VKTEWNLYGHGEPAAPRSPVLPSAVGQAAARSVERVGVCRDFTHLMIALCRALNIPTRIPIGTDFARAQYSGRRTSKRTQVYLCGRWYLFDPSGTAFRWVPSMWHGAGCSGRRLLPPFGAVFAKAPMIEAPAADGEGLVLPHHCREALSTSSATLATDSGCARFGRREAEVVNSAESLPN
jgi:hypothetical protein